MKVDIQMMSVFNISLWFTAIQYNPCWQLLEPWVHWNLNLWTQIDRYVVSQLVIFRCVFIVELLSSWYLHFFILGWTFTNDSFGLCMAIFGWRNLFQKIYQKSPYFDLVNNLSNSHSSMKKSTTYYKWELNYSTTSTILYRYIFVKFLWFATFITSIKCIKEEI